MIFLRIEMDREVFELWMSFRIKNHRLTEGSKGLVNLKRNFKGCQFFEEIVFKGSENQKSDIFYPGTFLLFYQKHWQEG